ncbi:MAG TPA: hypothetical protein VKB57_02405 [Acidimicrobiales bacterium]|nr:hypothetical protein [Acidimicrobiales bacterium]
MKFKIGLALGFAAGYWWASTTDEERRARFDELVGKVRDNPRIQQVTESVTRDAQRLTDAVTERVTTTADRTSDAVAGKVEPGNGGGKAAKPATASRKAG